jgi:hypothetical protein
MNWHSGMKGSRFRKRFRSGSVGAFFEKRSGNPMKVSVTYFGKVRKPALRLPVKLVRSQGMSKMCGGYMTSWSQDCHLKKILEMSPTIMYYFR